MSTPRPDSRSINDIVHLDGVYLGSGRHAAPLHPVPLDKSPVPSAGDGGKALVVVSWPQADMYADLTGVVGEARLLKGLEGVRQFQPIFGFGLKDRVDMNFLREKQVLSAVVERGSPLELTLEVNTESPSLRDRRRMGDIVLEIDVNVIVPVRRDGANDVALGRYGLNVELEPVVPEPDYGGVVALDFGTTGSTMVHMSQRESRPEALVLNKKEVETVAPTRVLITDVGAADRIGQTAGGAPPPKTVAECGSYQHKIKMYGHEELGSKRLLVAPDADKPLRAFFKGSAGHREQVRFSRSLPAELFIHEYFRRFREENHCRPQPLAATYPTTYTRKDIEAHRNAIGAAMRRLVGRELGGAVELLIDEASAACFYHVFHDLIDQPGGLFAARFEHPHGLNVLVFDCGGGTTDVALVHVSFKPEGSDGNGLVRLKVLGRSGDRVFGGDQMTRQVFRLVKFHLARGLGMVSGAAVGDPSRDLEAPDADSDKFVPTRWSHKGKVLETNQEKLHLKQQAVEQLWKVANEVKEHLDDQTYRKTIKLDPAIDALSRLLEAHDRISKNVASSLQAAVLAVKESDVQTLVQPLLEPSINKAASLIGELPTRLRRLVERDDGVDDACLPVVHRVYAVGNATRMKMVEKALQDRLGDRVRHRGTRIIYPAERKRVVAEGAALALASKHSYLQMSLHFDTHLADRLAYDVTVYNQNLARDVPIWTEDTLLSVVAATSKELQLPKVPEGDNLWRKIPLRRRWPGEARGEPYLVFRFPDGIGSREGAKVTIKFDPAMQQFVAVDEMGQVAQGEPDYAIEPCSPPQSGEL